MSIDIQKQLDLRPYRDNNVVSKPVEQPKTQAAVPPLDEEKSNAAKRMIGLTAAAVIAIGGLYTAKHGKLGETAEKWAKKLFGESVKEVKNSSGSSVPSVQDTVAPALALITPAFVRGKIKNPKFKLNDLVQELERANIGFNKIESNVPVAQTHIKMEGLDANWSFRFDTDGILKSIRKSMADDNQVVYHFDNNVLSKIKRKIPTENGKPLEHMLEFAENGKVKAKHLVRNEGLEKLPINSRALDNFKVEEIVETYVPRTSNFFNQAVDDIQIARNTLTRALESNTKITVDDILSPIQNTRQNGKTLKVVSPEKVKQIVEGSIEDKKLAGPIAQLIQQDVGDARKISLSTLVQLSEKYKSSLKAYGITKPEQLEVIAKPLDKCSKSDLITVLNSKEAVNKIFKGCFDEHGMLDVTQLSGKLGFSHIKGHMTIFDILKDIA